MQVIGLVCKTQLATAQVSDPIGQSMLLFAGMIITKRFIKPYALPVWYGLSIHYAFENMLTAILEHEGEDGETVLSYYGFHAGNRHFNYAVLVGMYFVWLAIGLYVARRRITGTNF